MNEIQGTFACPICKLDKPHHHPEGTIDRRLPSDSLVNQISYELERYINPYADAWVVAADGERTIYTPAWVGRIDFAHHLIALASRPVEAVATPAEVTDDMVARATAAYVGVEPIDCDVDVIPGRIRAAIQAALTAQCQVRKDGGVKETSTPGPRARGVAREPGRQDALTVYFDRNVSDDDMRKFHDAIASPSAGVVVPDVATIDDARARGYQDHARGWVAGWNDCRQAMLAAAPEVPGGGKCEHEWVIADNKYVSNASLCLKCNVIRPTNTRDAGSEVQS